MLFIDWDMNGKIDWQDELLEYELFNAWLESEKKEEDKNKDVFDWDDNLFEDLDEE